MVRMMTASGAAAIGTFLAFVLCLSTIKYPDAIELQVKIT